jgi:hypothetical protein
LGDFICVCMKLTVGEVDRNANKVPGRYPPIRYYEMFIIVMAEKRIILCKEKLVRISGQDCMIPIIIQKTNLMSPF